MTVGELRAALEGVADDLPVMLDNSVCGQYEHLTSRGVHAVWGGLDTELDAGGEHTVLILDVP